jgi:hypothetical protein
MPRRSDSWLSAALASGAYSGLGPQTITPRSARASLAARASIALASGITDGGLTRVMPRASAASTCWASSRSAGVAGRLGSSGFRARAFRCTGPGSGKRVRENACATSRGNAASTEPAASGAPRSKNARA